MPMPYYPPVSFDPTPDRFRRRRVMRGSDSDRPAHTSSPPNAHPPPVVLAPAGPPLIRYPESREPSPEPVVIPPPVILQEPQPGPPVEIPTSPPPRVRSPTRRHSAERSRTRSSRVPLRTRSSRERLPPVQRAVDSDADSYSPPSPHLQPKTLAVGLAPSTNSSQSTSSAPLASPPHLSPRKPVANEEPQSNVSTTLAPQPTSSIQPDPNPPQAPPPPVRRAVDSDADSYSPPSPHFQARPARRGPAPRKDSPQSSPSGSPRKPADDEEPQLNVSTLAPPTSSSQPNPNSPRAPLPPVPRAVDSDADSYSPPSPHLHRRDNNLLSGNHHCQPLSTFLLASKEQSYL
ncbi:hypothetical protein BS47DRAFT_1398378 [Hydnum rufescens UP504]|uniref:Uncharacterized protein n=1 Tax=Hydnum rufescens UP504 TaxID=1448309 RepID=A0A9P6ALE5_9AGAM|nr:hypothetical protein BS47DRAFT_1398378 [Hydnum rufescens UP504]